MSSKRPLSPSTRHKSYYSDRRNDHGRSRARDNGWGTRAGRDEGARESSRRRARSRSRSYDDKDSRSKMRDDHSDDRRGSSRYDSHRRDSRSRSPPRKRRRSRSNDRERSNRSSRRDYGRKDARDRDDRRYDDRRRDEREEETALARRERHLAQRSRSRSRSIDSEEKKIEQRKKPNWGNSGLLAAATNTVQRADGSATVLKYNEPPEARKPTKNWRLYEFKDDDNTAMLPIHRQSVYLFGRDAAVVDIPLDHPSCSKQHAAIQFRHVVEKNEYGEKRGIVKPFIIDLESTNGTHVNGETIPPARYYELKLSDIIKFGTSSREFVLLHESATE